MLDVWSRKIVGWAVHDEESAELAAALFRRDLSRASGSIRRASCCTPTMAAR